MVILFVLRHKIPTTLHSTLNELPLLQYIDLTQEVVISDGRLNGSSSRVLVTSFVLVVMVEFVIAKVEERTLDLSAFTRRVKD
jgi:hypothetical protein